MVGKGEDAGEGRKFSGDVGKPREEGLSYGRVEGSWGWSQCHSFQEAKLDKDRQGLPQSGHIKATKDSNQSDLGLRLDGKRKCMMGKQRALIKTTLSRTVLNQGNQ